MTEKQLTPKLQSLLVHIEDEEKKRHYERLISTLLEKGYFPGLAEVPVVKSAISHIDGERGILTFRGYPVEELAEYCSFEEVCYLILRGDLPLEEELQQLRRQLLAKKDLPAELARLIPKFSPTLHPMNMLSAAVLMLESSDKGSAEVGDHKAT